MTQYLDTPAQWRDLADRLNATPHTPGLDTEFIGYDIDKESAVDRAYVVCWSVAIPDGPLQPRGFRAAEGLVLPRAALFDPHLRAWLEDPQRPKVAHNARCDRHAIRNAGPDVLGLVDTVDLYRIVQPGRERYGLKPLALDYLGVEGAVSFVDLLSEPTTTEKVKLTTKKVCVFCGDMPNRFRKCPECQEPLVPVVVREVETVAGKKRLIPLQEVLGFAPVEGTGELTPAPGEHRLWDDFIDYAGNDAVWAAQLLQIARHMDQAGRKAKQINVRI